MKTKTLILTAAFGLTGALALGTTILGFDVDGVNGDVESLTASTLNANLSATSIVRSPELSANAGLSSFNSRKWNINDTIDLDAHFLSFTLQADSGYLLSINGISYKMQSSNTAPRTGRWGYSLDGGAFVLQNEFTIASGNGGGDGVWSDFNIENTIGVIEFRYWQYGVQAVGSTNNVTTGGTSRIRNLTGDDLVVTGSVTAIPEPGTLALVLLTGIAALVSLRRKRT